MRLDQKHVEKAAVLVLDALKREKSTVGRLQDYCLERDIDFTWDFHSAVLEHVQNISDQAVWQM